MHPILFKIGGVSIPSFGAIALVGLVVTILIQRKEAERLGYDPRKIEELVLLSILCAWVGSKTFYILQNPDTVRGAGLGAALQMSGYVFYGGVLAGVPAAWILARRAGIPGGRLVDIITPGMTFGLVIGRLGCLAAGCDYGRKADGPHWWTITYAYPPELPPELRVAPPDVPLYPSQPLMSLGFLLTFAIVYPLRKRLTPWPGAVLALYLIVEPPLRFLIEFTRGDEDRGFLGPLSTSQTIAAAMVPIGIAALVWLTRRAPSPPPSRVGTR